VPELAKSRQVIATELQGHGHTADIDRPFSYEQMADDVAALLRHLQVDEADLFGFSMGGGVALQVAIRHPEVVRKLVVASASYTSEGLYPEVGEAIETITPELFEGTPLLEEYTRVAPNPDDFPTLVAKPKQLDIEPLPGRRKTFEGLWHLPCSSSTIPMAPVSSTQSGCLGCSAAASSATSSVYPSPGSRCSPALRTSSPRLCGLGPRRLAGCYDWRVPRCTHAGGRVSDDV